MWFIGKKKYVQYENSYKELKKYQNANNKSICIYICNISMYYSIHVYIYIYIIEYLYMD